jgi:hypothetical protein
MQPQRRLQREMPVDEVRNSLAAGRAVAPDAGLLPRAPTPPFRALRRRRIRLAAWPCARGYSALAARLRAAAYAGQQTCVRPGVVGVSAVNVQTRAE